MKCDDLSGGHGCCLPWDGSANVAGRICETALMGDGQHAHNHRRVSFGASQSLALSFFINLGFMFLTGLGKRVLCVVRQMGDCSLPGRLRNTVNQVLWRALTLTPDLGKLGHLLR